MPNTPKTTPPRDPELQVREVCELLKLEEVPWPGATVRSKEHDIEPGYAVANIQEVLERLARHEEERLEEWQAWQAKQGDLTAVFGAFLPGIIAVPETRRKLIATCLEALEELERSSEEDADCDAVLRGLASIVRRDVPEEA